MYGELFEKRQEQIKEFRHQRDRLVSRINGLVLQGLESVQPDLVASISWRQFNGFTGLFWADANFPKGIGINSILFWRTNEAVEREFPAHSHPQTETIICHQGHFQTWMEVDGRRKMVEMEPGKMVTIPGGTVHGGFAWGPFLSQSVFSPALKDFTKLEG